MKPLIITTLEYPPVPDRSHDWSARFNWYDGDDDQPIGWGETEEIAVVALLVDAVEWDGDGAEQDAIVVLALIGWKTAKPKEKPND